MRYGRPAQMVFAAFDAPQNAVGVLEELQSKGFKPGGFGLIAREQDRGAMDDSDLMGELMNQLTHAPAMSVDGRDVASAGSVPGQLDPGADGAMAGLRAALQNAGASAREAGEIERTLANGGVVLAVAAADPIKGADAATLFRDQGARVAARLAVPPASGN
ncbi:MAG TPA: hypothetical protein RMG48_08895 [Myxococcales bacterium LLY-WYZ-16_1]|nr:hypothetical protein [Myxococcales bacterium LLY-WYZ-16_1]